ncbi:MAG: SapC family protein [Deltaproteobacteria bacterium]|nr:SapC family protein [Deltaproteobacteria bacterium]
MFKKIEPIDKIKHNGLRFAPGSDLTFARKLSFVPLGAREIFLASRYYPIVFPLDGVAVPQALLSLRKEHNSYINAEGKWIVPYVPMHVRRYPFLLASPTPAGQEKGEVGKLVLCIDRDAENFKTEEGEPLFDEKGEPGKTTATAIEMLRQFQGDLKACEKLFQQLDEQGCLITKQAKIENEGVSLGSFRVVDFARVQELDDAVLAGWVRNGLLGLAYALNFSLANFDRFGTKIKVV